MRTIRPCPFAFMPGVTARATWNAPSTFTAWMARQSPSVTSSSGPAIRPRTPPAAWTAISTGADPVHQRVDGRGVGDIEFVGLDRGAGSRSGFADQFAFDIRCMNLCALGGEGMDDGAPDAARRAGHEDALAGKRNFHPVSPALRRAAGTPP